MSGGGSRSADEQGRVERVRRRIEAQRTRMEERPLAGFVITTVRRFLEIDGGDLTLIIGTNMFVAIIPLFIILYSVAVRFNPKRSVANVFITRFALDHTTAGYVTRTFPTAASGRNTALIISVGSLLITGFGVAAAVQKAYARSFRMHTLRGLQKYARGLAWLFLLVFTFGLNLALRDFAAHNSYWWLILIVPTLAVFQFGFYLVTPRLVLDLPFEWADLRPGAMVCVVGNWVVSLASAFALRYWLHSYGRAYGPFGVGLAILSWIGITAGFWVWLAAVSGVYWERYAGAEGVVAMGDLSDARAAAEPGRPERSD